VPEQLSARGQQRQPVVPGIEEAYAREPEGRLRGCPSCHVSWFGTDDRCWMCGGRDDGPAATVPPNGSESWSAARCADTADTEETAALLRLAGPQGDGSQSGHGIRP
jgi:hypothetical protein